MRRCLDCGTLIRRGSRCRLHERIHQQKRNQQRGGTGWAWQAIRQRILSRDGGCTETAPHDCRGRLEVDHIVPIEEGGPNADANLTTLCQVAHRAKGQRDRERRRAMGRSG